MKRRGKRKEGKEGQEEGKRKMSPKHSEKEMCHFLENCSIIELCLLEVKNKNKMNRP